MRLEAVTFDFWNTLIKESPAPLELRVTLWQEKLESEGHPVTGEQLDSAFEHAWSRFEVRWRANQQSTFTQMASDALDALDQPLAENVRVELAELFLAASLMTPRELLPGVEETFDRLQGLGVRIGIVSDVGGVPSSQMRTWLDELGVHHLINHFSFSDEVGVFKPSMEIFEDALRGLLVSHPSAAAHVGDLRRTDMLGANRIGMISVQFTGGRTDDDDSCIGADSEPDHVIDDMFDLLSALNLT